MNNIIIQIIFAASLTLYFIVGKKINYWETLYIFGFKSETPMIYSKYRVLYILLPKILFIISLIIGLFLPYHPIIVVSLLFIAFIFSSRIGIRSGGIKNRQILKKLHENAISKKRKNEIDRELQKSDRELYQEALKMEKLKYEIKRSMH